MKDIHWLKSVPTSKNVIVTQKGLKTTQVYIDRSSVTKLQAKYQELLNSGVRNVESFLMVIMGWDYTDLVPAENIEGSISERLSDPYKLKSAPHRAYGVKDPDTNKWVMIINSMPKGLDLDKPLLDYCPSKSIQTRFREYLHRVNVPLGILYNEENLRFMFVDTDGYSGCIDFGMNEMALSSGNGAEILAGLESLLNAQRMFNLSLDRRLINIIKNSRPQKNNI
jgi:hypothetical protein